MVFYAHLYKKLSCNMSPLVELKFET